MLSAMLRQAGASGPILKTVTPSLHDTNAASKKCDRAGDQFALPTEGPRYFLDILFWIASLSEAPDWDRQRDPHVGDEQRITPSTFAL